MRISAFYLPIARKAVLPVHSTRSETRGGVEDEGQTNRNSVFIIKMSDTVDAAHSVASDVKSIRK